MELINNDFRQCEWPSNIQTIICDPPYNIGFNYKGGYKDNIKEENYNILIKELLEYSFNLSNDTANMFLINYPEQMLVIVKENLHVLVELYCGLLRTIQKYI